MEQLAHSTLAAATITAAQGLQPCRLVTASGAYPDAGAAAYGATKSTAGPGGAVDVLLARTSSDALPNPIAPGTALVEIAPAALGVLSPGDPVSVDELGRVVYQQTDGGQALVGQVVRLASSDHATPMRFAEVALVR